MHALRTTCFAPTLLAISSVFGCAQDTLGPPAHPRSTSYNSDLSILHIRNATQGFSLSAFLSREEGSGGIGFSFRF
jgi:hypothetical protein